MPGMNPLPPPSFELPPRDEDDDNDSDDSSDDDNGYELWTVRLPASVNVESLQGIEFDLDDEDPTTFQANDQNYTLQQGSLEENAQFRLLLRDDNNLLQPHSQPFDRHLNVTLASGASLEDTHLAPRLETAPTPTDTIRRSYSHVPQATGLKRRWMPAGVSVNVASSTSNVNESEDDSSDSSSDSSDSSDSSESSDDDTTINGVKSPDSYSSQSPSPNRLKTDKTTRRLNLEDDGADVSSPERVKNEDAVHMNGHHKESPSPKKKKSPKKECKEEIKAKKEE